MGRRAMEESAIVVDVDDGEPMGLHNKYYRADEMPAQRHVLTRAGSFPRYHASGMVGRR